MRFLVEQLGVFVQVVGYLLMFVPSIILDLGQGLVELAWADYKNNEDENDGTEC